MSIGFTNDQWDGIAEEYTKWWQGDLKRPLIQVCLHGADTDLAKPALPYHHFAAFYDSDQPAEKVVEAWEYQLSTYRYLGDGFPSIWNNFGPGVIAAFLGANLECGDSTVWFHPKEDQEVSDINFSFQPDNVWFNRVKDIYSAAVDRFQGRVQLGMTDLGGNLDILSTFRPSERLLYDLYDHPQAVKDLTWQAHEMWFKYYQELNSILQPANPGYTAWCPIFSTEPYYILQCDFCYMIGPDMFDEFVKPELAAACKKLSNPFYHLDGPGQLAHLDSLLEIEELKGVQWVPGDGAKPCSEWPEVYRKIRDAGKLIQLYGGAEVLDAVASQLGSAEGIILIANMSVDRADEARELIDKYS